MIRLALIGTKDEAARFAALIPRIPSARLTALVDCAARPSPNPIANGEIIAGDLQSLLSNHSADFDAVIVLGNARRDFAECHQAAKAGKHLLVDDLFSRPSPELATLDSGCASANVRLMAADSLRFLPEIQAILKSLRSGQLGEPGLLRVHCWEPKDSKSMQPLASLVDLALWCLDNVPQRSYATARPSAETTLRGYDYLQAHLGFDSDGMVLIDHARTLPPGDGYFSVTLVGSKGAAYADDHHNMHLLYRGGRPTAIRGSQDDVQTVAVLREFVAAIEDNREPLASGADALRAIQATDAVAESLATKTVVEFARNSDNFTPSTAAEFLANSATAACR